VLRPDWTSGLSLVQPTSPIGEYEKDGADAYMSLCKARHWDGAEMDLDLSFDMASLNFYMHDLPPTQLGMNEKVRPNGGVVGELESVHLNDG